MIYLEVILWWLIVPTVAVAAGCGIWEIISYCRREYLLARLWDDRDTFPRDWVQEQQRDREGDAA